MRIGIISPWFERGIAYASLMMYQALAKQHEVFVLAQTGRPKFRGSEWIVPNLSWGSKQAFQFPFRWARKNELEVLIFNEKGGSQEMVDLRRAGIKTLCLQEWESLDPRNVPILNRSFDGIIAPTLAAYERFCELGLLKVYYIPWGADLELFCPQERHGPLRFFHPAGYGGVGGRRGTKETQIAFDRVEAKGASLLITSQRRARGETKRNSTRIIYDTLLREELARLYREADVALLPSKWEGLGLTFLEALASGLAIITVDAPPMNGYVFDGWNGYCCETTMVNAKKGVHVSQARISLEDFERRITNMCLDPDLTREMGRRSRRLAEDQFDWRIKGQTLLQAVEDLA